MKSVVFVAEPAPQEPAVAPVPGVLNWPEIVDGGEVVDDLDVLVDLIATLQQIKQAIIQASIAAYSGNCPCPYNVDRGGRRCGRRSAYNRPGGASPICFEEDITPAMVEAHRKRAAK